MPKRHANAERTVLQNSIRALAADRWAAKMPPLLYTGSCVDCRRPFAAFSLAVHQKVQHGRRWPVRGIIPRWFMLPEEDQP